MKLNVAKAGHYDSGPNMTPLVDIVMVLLIFLMLTGKFGGQEHFLVSTSPITQRGAGGAPPPPGFVPDEPLEIRVDSPAPDRYVARADGVAGGDFETLAAQLRALRLRLNAANKPTEKIQVVISPTRTARYAHLIDVYQAALAAEFEKVGFAPAR
ncbi:MAG: ExbD/TolR family protein [Tepidisphaerales bacterium]